MKFGLDNEFIARAGLPGICQLDSKAKHSKMSSTEIYCNNWPLYLLTL